MCAITLQSLKNIKWTAKRKNYVYTVKAQPGHYPPGHEEIPAAYKSIGQPMIIPGDMGRYSYVMVGTEIAQ